MCGIIGIISKENVLPDLFVGMIGLQHRGQDSAGIVSYSNGLKCRKSTGLVEQVFTSFDLASLSANIAIGQTRYPTIGSNPSKDAQPFFSTVPHEIALAHNGNVTNYAELRQHYGARGKSFESSCDAEAILAVLCNELSSTQSISVEDVFEAIPRLFDIVKGAYSVVALIPSIGLLAFRDPFGIKPLILCEKAGGKERSIGFASESIALESTGFELKRDLLPGEAIIIDFNFKIHSMVFSRNKPNHCMFEWVYFSRSESKLEGTDVYAVRKKLGIGLAEYFKKSGKKADIVCAVPDTSVPAALALSEAAGLPYKEAFLKNRYIGRTFIMASQQQREHSVKLKLTPIVSEIKGKSILLVDDSIVRATTSKKIIGLLKEKGAKEVFLASTCPPIKCPCFYGIDMPLKSELIASAKTIQEIREFIGADFLLYNDVEGLKKAIGFDSLCTACLTGEYPVPLSDGTIKKVEQTRVLERQKL